MAKAAPHKRHTVDLFRVSDTLDSRGQRDPANDTTVAADVPASIEPLNGRELELSRQIMASATTKVRIYVDPAWNLTPGDYLRRKPAGNTDDLEIGFIQYDQDVVHEAILTCGERVPT